MRFLFPPIRRTLGGSKGIPGFRGLLISSVAIRDVRHRRGATWDPLHENINGRGSFRARRCGCVYAEEPNTTRLGRVVQRQTVSAPAAAASGSPMAVEKPLRLEGPEPFPLSRRHDDETLE